MSERQAATAYARGDVANLRKLIRGSPWFERIHVLGKHWELREPVMRWEPGDGEPDFERVSYVLKGRWEKNPTEPMACCRATRIAFGIFGGTRQKSGSSAHDLGVAAIFQTLRARREADDWMLQGGHASPPAGTKHPDAYAGRRALDFGGCYGPGRIRELVEMAFESSRPLEVW